VIILLEFFSAFQYEAYYSLQNNIEHVKISDRMQMSFL